MSSIKELRENPDNIVNVTRLVETILKDRKSKYVELLLRLIKDNLDLSINDSENTGALEEYGLKFTNETSLEKLFLLLILRCTFGNDDAINNILYFCDKHNQNAFSGVDTQMISLDDIDKHNEIQREKDKIKQRESEVIKLLDNDDWLIILPLTLESSLKYGSNTKWCTASENNPDHFDVYTSEGILIYLINKKDNVKHAIYVNTVDTNYGASNITLWDEADECVELLLTYFPPIVLEIIRNFINENKEKTNKKLHHKEVVTHVYDIETRSNDVYNIFGTLIEDPDLDNNNDNRKWSVSNSPFGYMDFIKNISRD